MLKSLIALSLAFGSYLLKVDLTETQKKDTLDSLATAMKSRYVSQDTAEVAVRKLEAERKLGTYDSIQSGDEFAKLLTTHLNEVCKDAHLRVFYREETLPARKDQAQPSPEEIKRQSHYVVLSNSMFERIERLPGNIGLLKFDGFQEPKEMERPCKAAFDFLANTDALIIDLRQNGGGSPDGVKHICSYLFGPKPVHLNDLYFREGNRTIQFWTQKSVPGKRYENKPVFLLIGKRTGSGAEEFAYDLKNLKRATLIGENTWGGANPGGVVRLNDHFAAFIPVGKAINPYTKTNWEGTGVDPDIRADAKDAMGIAHRMAVETLLTTLKDPDDQKRLGSVLEELKKPVNP